MVGTANLTPPAGLSLLEFILLLYSSIPRFVALYACKTAGLLALSTTHTIPPPVPLEETAGVGVGNEKLVEVTDVAVADTGGWLFALKENAFKGPAGPPL